MSYGCWNRAPLQPVVVVQTGWMMRSPKDITRSPRMTQVPDPMTKDCQYTLSDLGRTDPGCVGCKHKAVA